MTNSRTKNGHSGQEQTDRFESWIASLGYTLSFPGEQRHDLSGLFSQSLVVNSNDQEAQLNAIQEQEFLEWCMQSISAPVNVPGIKQTCVDLEAELSRGVDVTDDKIREHDQFMRLLDHQHAQLSNTLENMERELQNLNIQENKQLSVQSRFEEQITTTSIEFDIVISDFNRIVQQAFIPDTSSPSSMFLYQSTDVLDTLAQLDQSLLDGLVQLLRNVKSVVGDKPYSSGTSAVLNDRQSMTVNSKDQDENDIFEQLLSSNPEQRQEIEKLCTLYRVTKMNHVRAMARFKSLEEEVSILQQIEQDVEAQKKQKEAMDDIEENGGRVGEVDTHDDLTMTIGNYSSNHHSSRNNIYGKSNLLKMERKQELELISVQRELTRLVEELSLDLTCSEAMFGSSSSTSSASSPLSPTLSRNPRQQLHASSDDGVGITLEDICERIAQVDIELQYLTSLHDSKMDWIENRIIKRGLEPILEDLLSNSFASTQIVNRLLMNEQTDRILQCCELVKAVVKEIRVQMLDVVVVDRKKQGKGQRSRSKSDEMQIDTAENYNQSSRQLQQQPPPIQGNQLLALPPTDLLSRISNLAQLEQQLTHKVVFSNATTNQVQFASTELMQAQQALLEMCLGLQQDVGQISMIMRKGVNKQ